MQLVIGTFLAPRLSVYVERRLGELGVAEQDDVEEGATTEEAPQVDN